MKFAIIQTGGKQYKVTEGMRFKVEKLEVEAGAPITLDKVLLVSDGDDVKIGMPYVKGALVAAKVVQQTRDKKKIVFKFHNKTRLRKKKGHKQPLTELLIEKIS